MWDVPTHSRGLTYYTWYAITSRDMQRFPMVVRLFILLLPLCSTWLRAPAVYAQADAGERYVLLIGGLGGNDEYTETFQEYLFSTRQAFVDGFDVPTDHITVLAETESASGDFVTDVSTAENIRNQFGELAEVVDENDQVYIILFGHGSFSGEQARINIPRRDLSDADFAELLDRLNVERTVFVNTTNSSGPFIETLSGTDRIIITATRSGRQRNETIFPRFFIEAFTAPAADIDQNNRLSVHEAFQYAAQKTAEWFSDEGHVASEHALLEDNGDGQGARLEELEETGDGNLAAVTYFDPPDPPAAAAGTITGDSLAAVQAQRRALEKKIASLKSEKNQMAADEYYAQLEELLVQLARLSHSADSTSTPN